MAKLDALTLIEFFVSGTRGHITQSRLAACLYLADLCHMRWCKHTLTGFQWEYNTEPYEGPWSQEVRPLLESFNIHPEAEKIVGIGETRRVQDMINAGVLSREQWFSLESIRKAWSGSTDLGPMIDYIRKTAPVKAWQKTPTRFLDLECERHLSSYDRYASVLHIPTSDLRDPTNDHKNRLKPKQGHIFRISERHYGIVWDLHNPEEKPGRELYRIIPLTDQDVALGNPWTFVIKPSKGTGTNRLTYALIDHMYSVGVIQLRDPDGKWKERVGKIINSKKNSDLLEIEKRIALWSEKIGANQSWVKSYKQIYIYLTRIARSGDPRKVEKLESEIVEMVKANPTTLYTLARDSRAPIHERALAAKLYVGAWRRFAKQNTYPQHLKQEQELAGHERSIVREGVVHGLGELDLLKELEPFLKDPNSVVRQVTEEYLEQ